MATDTDLAKLGVFADALRKSPARANAAGVKALQAGAEEARRLGTNAISQEYNLDANYIQKHLTVKKNASAGDLLTKISAARRSVLATRYGADQHTVSTKTKRVSGDPYRKIPRGRKAAGSTPWQVKKGGGGTAWSNAFFIWGKNSGAWMMVTRASEDPKSALQPVYGLSVHQAWSYIREDVTPATMKVVVDTFTTEFKKG